MPDINVKIEEPEAISIKISEPEPISVQIVEAEPINVVIIEGVPTVVSDIFRPPEGGFNITKLYFKDGKFHGEYEARGGE